MYRRKGRKRCGFGGRPIKGIQTILGPVEIELKLLDGIPSGAPEYLTKDNVIAYFFEVVNRMKDAYGKWDKGVEEQAIFCPICGSKWELQR